MSTPSTLCQHSGPYHCSVVLAYFGAKEREYRCQLLTAACRSLELMVAGGLSFWAHNSKRIHKLKRMGMPLVSALISSHVCAFRISMVAITNCAMLDMLYRNLLLLLQYKRTLHAMLHHPEPKEETHCRTYYSVVRFIILNRSTGEDFHDSPQRRPSGDMIESTTVHSFCVIMTVLHGASLKHSPMTDAAVKHAIYRPTRSGSA